MTTLSDLVLAAKQRCDLENSGLIRPAEAKFMVNSSAAELYGMLVTEYEDYFTTTLQYNMASGQDGYDLPADFLKIRGLDFFSGGQFVNVHRFNFEDRNIVNRPINLILVGLNNLRYRVVGSRLLIIPPDEGGGLYRLWYIPKYKAMINDSDLLENNMDMEYWAEFIVVDVAIKMAQKEESDAMVATLMAQKAALKLRIEDEASNRDAAQPERVTDVRGINNAMDAFRW